ncbi:MAG: hypothetical protein WDN69_00130 [Aliidongia sp.]
MTFDQGDQNADGAGAELERFIVAQQSPPLRQQSKSTEHVVLLHSPSSTHRRPEFLYRASLIPAPRAAVTMPCAYVRDVRDIELPDLDTNRLNVPRFDWAPVWMQERSAVVIAKLETLAPKHLTLIFFRAGIFAPNQVIRKLDQPASVNAHCASRSSPVPTLDYSEIHPSI